VERKKRDRPSFEDQTSDNLPFSQPKKIIENKEKAWSSRLWESIYQLLRATS
jgi:hypothetical protein